MCESRVVRRRMTGKQAVIVDPVTIYEMGGSSQATTRYQESVGNSISTVADVDDDG